MVSDVKDQLKKIASQTAKSFGVHRVTFRDLGKAINIKSSSVFYHFGSKDKLLHEIAQDYINEFLAKLNEVGNRKVNALTKILALLNLFEETYKNNSFCLCGMLTVEFNELDKSTILLLNDFFDEIEKWIVKVIVLDNTLPEKEAKMYASVIISALEGGLMIDRMNDELNHLHAIKVWLKSLL